MPHSKWRPTPGSAALDAKYAEIDYRTAERARTAELEAEVERLRADATMWKNRAHRHAQTMADALDAKTVEDARRILLRE